MKKTGTIALICALALSLMNAPAAGAWAVLPDGGTPGHGVHMAQGEQTAAVEEDTGLIYEDEEALSRLLGELPSTITEAQAEEAGHILRLKEEEPDLNTVIFQNRDGTRTAYQYAYPVKYIENGTIKDKSNRIISSDKAGYAYENEANEIKTYYPERLGNKGARLEYGGYAVELMPQIRGGGAAYSLFGGGSLQAAQVIEEITPAADGVHYSGALGAGAALRYTPTLTGFKEDIILSSYQGENEFSFVLKTNGLLLEETGGNWYLIDEDTEEAVIELGEIYIYDSFSGITAGAEGGENVHETYGELGAEEIERGEEYIITVTAPEEYLEAGSTVYPVYIDPTFNVVSTYIQDTHISSGYPGNNYNTSALLNLGYGSSSKSTRILSRITSLSNGIQQPGWEPGVQVDSVIYHMYCTSSYTSNPYVDVYRAGASWSTTGATWSNASSSTYSGAVLLSSTQVGNKGWYEFDITGAYNYWLTPGMTNNGLLFKMRVESSTENYWRQFASATYSDSSKLPYLTVVYNEPVSIEINPYSMRLYMGESYRPAISATPSGAALGVAYWSSSNTSVARVNSTTGEITAVGAGTATVTVTIYTGVTTATGSCSVSVFSGTPPAVMGEVYHIFNANSTKPISPREGNVTDNGQVAQESYRPASAGYQKWEVIRLFNGYYVIRSAQNSNMALSGAGTLLKLSNIGGSNNYSDVPMEAQWTLSGSAGSELNLTARSSGKGICIEGDTVWAGENIIMGSAGSKSKGFLFIRPGDYVPTTGVSLQNPIYLLKNGNYICMPQITPSNATFRRVIWSWEGRGSGPETDITMQNYAWGTSTASYTGTIVTGINEGVTWLRAYCSDTNYNLTIDVNVVWNNCIDMSRVNNLKMDIENILGTGPKSILHYYSPNDCLDIILEYDAIITQYCNQYFIPKEYVQTLLLRELWCYNTGDSVADTAVENTYLYLINLEEWNSLSEAEKLIVPMPVLPVVYKDDSSTGLCQIFARTAIDANNQAIYEGLITGKEYDVNDWHDVYYMWELLHNNNEFNIKMLVLEVINCARKTNTSNIFWAHNAEHTKTVLSRYNGTGNEADEYGDECYDYFEIFKSYN